MDDRFGFIHEKIDIKILILFVTGHLSEPVDLDTLTDLTLCDDGISYFDFVECVSELAGTEHVSTDGASYRITEKGARNGKITENFIPYSVRMKAEKNTAELRMRQNRKALIKTSRTLRRKGGYSVALSLSDGLDEIISMSLYAASEDQAVALEKGFSEKAEAVYNDIIKMILG